jgi:hypothetical protein
MVSDWTYGKNKIQCINDMKIHEPKVWGFVYLLSLYDKTTKQLIHQYIGKKNIYSKRKRNFGKKEIADITDKRKKTYEYIIKESDWQKYLSSNLFIKKNISKFAIKREIICFSTNDSDLTYKEAKEIICQGALETPFFLNDGVSIRRFKGKLIN